MVQIEAKGKKYQQLNQEIHQSVAQGNTEIELKSVNGQRYIGTGLRGNLKITIHGVPGNDLASLMDGPIIEVFGNAQDAIGNTMNEGKVIIHGNTSDTLGYAMRGGKIYIQGEVGYRVGIHMKAYQEKEPVIVIGEKAGNFFGEYMAGGTLILLGLNLGDGEEIAGDYIGTGMHGGRIFIRKEVPTCYLGKEVKVVEPDEEDLRFLKQEATTWTQYFGGKVNEIMKKQFIKLIPYNKRPYGNLYAY